MSGATVEQLRLWLTASASGRGCALKKSGLEAKWGGAGAWSRRGWTGGQVGGNLPDSVGRTSSVESFILRGSAKQEP